MSALIAAGDAVLAPYQPSQRCCLLDGARDGARVPAADLVSALVAVEKTRDAAGLREGAAGALTELLRTADMARAPKSCRPTR